MVGAALSVVHALLGCGAVTTDEPKRDASTVVDSGAIPSTDAGDAANCAPGNDCEATDARPVGPAHAFVAASLLSGASGSCALTDTPVVFIGTNETGVPTGTGGVTVTCSVTPSGNGFRVIASASTATSAFAITGTLFDGDPTAMQAGVTASFASNATGVYTSDGDEGCTVNVTATPAEPDATGIMGIAAGRVWGNLGCPTLSEPKGTSICEGIAEFKFEDCAE
jgi:hypothetical protein